MQKSTMREHMNERLGKVFNFCDNPPLPKSLNIELNNSCNHSCVFCPFHGKFAPNTPKPAVLSADVVKRILDNAKDLGIGEKEVGFYLAGEPFLYRDLAEVIAYAKKLKYKYTFLTSNGAFATPDKMRDVLDAGLDSIRISINAADRETYKTIHGKDDFERVVENVKYMAGYIKQHDLQVATSISCVITKKTIGIQSEIKDIFGDFFDDILFIPVMLNRLNCDDEFVEEYQLVDDSDAEINTDFVCPILFDTMYINANMEVVPCCEAYDSNCVFYDLKSDLDLNKAWNSEGYQKYRNIFLRGETDENTLCKTCILRMKGIKRFSIE